MRGMLCRCIEPTIFSKGPGVATIYKKSIAEMRDAQSFTSAEEKLIAECRFGKVVGFGDTRPDSPNDNNQIRAELIRHLMLGGCKDVPVHQTGVMLRGAYITGELNLENCSSDFCLYLADCRFEQAPNLVSATLHALYLPGCSLPGLDAQRLNLRGDLFLRDKFYSFRLYGS